MLNVVMVQGRLVADPEFKAEIGIAKIRVAVNIGKDKTAFLSVTAFQKTAEFVMKHFKKGDPIIVEGKINQHTYEKDGQKVTVTDIIANNFHFCGGTRGSDDSSAPAAPKTLPASEDVPF